MNKFISERFALRAVMVILSTLVVFHLLVLLQIIPFDMVWAGKVGNVEEMRPLELTSVIITLLMLVVVSIRAGYLYIGVNKKIVNIILWAMFLFFCLNTIGNMLSTNPFEQMVFTPVTLLLSLFMFRIIRTKKA